MYLFAHLGYTFLVAEIIALVYFIVYLRNKVDAEKYGWGINVFSAIPLAIGALGPDIIDKLISLPITGHGRYIGHSLLFDLVAVLVAFLIFRKKPAMWISFAMGWQMHLLLDWGFGYYSDFMPWFFPFISYEFPVREGTLWSYILVPQVYYNEIGGGLSILFLLALYNRREMSLRDLYNHVRGKKKIAVELSQEHRENDLSEP